MRSRPLPTAALVTVAALFGLACSSDDSTGSEASATTIPQADSPTTTTAPENAILAEALVCDPLDERACLLPWPNDAFTRPDATTPTGRRLDIQAGSTPSNTAGVPIDVTDQNRGDGFSPGSAILAMVPGLDVEVTGIAASTDIGASLDNDAPVVILDTTTGERVAYWGELDAQAPTGNQLL
ncbi:MAG: hypothetical protein HY826_00570, partial [Actinobacteria bacterium]|nr:hypothetical protein [Actinomycetota bacterium]